MKKRSSLSETTPLRVGISSCLLGTNCTYQGENMFSDLLAEIAELTSIEFIAFCPEAHALGTPRPNQRIVGGSGQDVLKGTAKVINALGEDVTEASVAGAKEFVRRLEEKSIEHAVLTEGSPSCGSQLLLKEHNWPQGGFVRGEGVAAALLRQNGIEVLSHLNEKSIRQFFQLNDEQAKDLKDHPKFSALFNT